MSLQHILKNSSISGKEPLASQLANGELSINYHADGPFLCCKDTAGNVRRVAGVWVATTAPSTPFPGELWLDTSITPSQLKVYKDTTDAWVFAGEVNTATTTTEGLVRLATDVDTQAGTNATSAVTPASLQSKISDSTTTVSSTTIASSTAVKNLADTVNAALPKSGGTITGTLEIGNTGQLRFEGSSNDGFETTLAVEDPTGTRTITLPNRTGTVITTGDTGTITSTMIVDDTIVNADINANAEIAVSKLADGTARQLLQTDAAGTGVEWTSNVDIPGTLDVTGATTLDSTLSVSGRVGIGTSSPTEALSVTGNIALTTSDQATITVGSGSQTGPHKVDVRSGGVATDFGYYLNGTPRLFSNSSDANVTSIACIASGSITFINGTSEVARLDGSGRLLVGTSTARGVGQNAATAPLQIETASNVAALQIVANSNNAASPSLFFGKSRGGSLGSNTIVQDGDTLGGIAFCGADGNDLNSYGAEIKAQVNGTPGADDMPGRLVFSTTADGASSPTERVTIDSSGNVGIGTSSPGTTLDVNGDVKLASLNGGPLAGFRNRIINGNFNIWQRGTSFSPAANTYTADRWVVFYDGSGATRTVSRQIFNPGSTEAAPGAAFFLEFNQSVAGSGGTYNSLAQRIEGVRTFGGQTVTLSFYARGVSAALTLPAIGLSQAFGVGGSATVFTTVASNVVIAGTNFAKYTYTVTLPSIIGKTIGTGSHLSLEFGMPNNATFNFQIASVQLEPGSAATPFERRPIGAELALCQRYFTSGRYQWIGYQAASNIAAETTIPISPPMRVAPTVFISNSFRNAFSAEFTNKIEANYFSVRALTSAASNFAEFIGAYTASAEL